MKLYIDAELEAMLADLESDCVERKQSFRGDAPTTVREAVCAFANDLPRHGRPGVVFIGARDDGNPVDGFDVSDELLRQLADIKTDGNIVPPPTLLVEKRHLSGHDLAVVTVWPCDSPPVRFKQRIHVRWGPRRGLASAQDERILNERRRHRDRPFDVQPVADATLDELDRLRFEQEYLPAVVARDVLAANERSAYLVTEFTGEVIRFERDDATGVLTPAESVSIVDPGAGLSTSRLGADPMEEHLIWGADVHLAQFGSFLLATERTASTVATVSMEPEGLLGSVIGLTPTEAQPRGFAVAPDNRHVVVAGERSGGVALYELSDEGILTELDRRDTGSGANWVRFA